MDDLSRKVALVTGASRGIGRAIALALAHAGADVVVNFRTHPADAQELQEQIRSHGRRSTTIQADVSTPAGVERLLTCAAELGPVEILVNNAGIARPQPIQEITEQDWDELIDVNLKSCFLMTQAFLPGMRSRKWG